jgi:mannose-6-phosphate isomerase-like protein (cupin superfamily)
MANRILELSSLQWKESRPDVASAVFGHQFLPRGAMAHSVSLTRVEPGGLFKTHSDDYNHVFYFIQGTGTGAIGEKSYQIKPGLTVEVTSGTPHKYENTGQSEMLLLTINYRML